MVEQVTLAGFLAASRPQPVPEAILAPALKQDLLGYACCWEYEGMKVYLTEDWGASFCRFDARLVAREGLVRPMYARSRRSVLYAKERFESGQVWAEPIYKEG